MVEKCGPRRGEDEKGRWVRALRNGLGEACVALGEDDAAAEQRAKAVSAVVRAARDFMAFEDGVRTPKERNVEQIRAELERRLNQFIEQSGAARVSEQPRPRQDGGDA